MCIRLATSWLALVLVACSSTTVIRRDADAGASGSSGSEASGSSGASRYGAECTRYLRCCEIGENAAQCEAAVTAAGGPSAAEPFCKASADATRCP